LQLHAEYGGSTRVGTSKQIYNAESFKLIWSTSEFFLRLTSWSNKQVLRVHEYMALLIRSLGNWL